MDSRIIKTKFFKSLKEGIKEINPQTLAGLAVSASGELMIANVDFGKITEITKAELPIITYNEDDVWIGSIQINRNMRIVELYGNNSAAHEKAIILANKMAKMMWINKISNAFFPIHFGHLPKYIIYHGKEIKKIPDGIENLRIIKDDRLICVEKNNIYKFSIEDKKLQLIWTNNKIGIKFLGRPNGNKIPITFANGNSSILTILDKPKGIMSAFIDKKIPTIKAGKFIGIIHIEGISIVISETGSEIIFYPVSF